MDGASDSGSGAASEVEYSTATAFQMKRCITKATVPGMVKTLVRVKGDADKETRETFVLTLDYYITPIKCLRLLIKNYKQTPTLSKTSITFERDQKVARVRVINVLVTLLEYRYQTLKHITEWQDILDKFLEFLETDVHGAPFVKIITSKMNPSPPRKSNELDTPTDTKSKRSSARVPFNICDYDPMELANQMTILDHDFICLISLDDLFEGRYRDEGHAKKTTTLAVEHSNNMTYWISSEILLAPTKKARVGLIVAFINVLQRLRDLNNFYGMRQVYSALSVSNVQRLEKEWRSVPSQVMQMYQKLETIIDPRQNSKGYRTAWKRKRAGPCVPALDLLFHDCFHAEEAPTFMDKEKQYVNWTKMRELARNFKLLVDSQRILYDIKPRNDILEFLREIKHKRTILTVDEMHLKSVELTEEHVPEPSHQKRRQSGGKDMREEMRMSKAREKLIEMTHAMSKTIEKKVLDNRGKTISKQMVTLMTQLLGSLSSKGIKGSTAPKPTRLNKLVNSSIELIKHLARAGTVVTAYYPKQKHSIVIGNSDNFKLLLVVAMWSLLEYANSTQILVTPWLMQNTLKLQITDFVPRAQDEPRKANKPIGRGSFAALHALRSLLDALSGKIQWNMGNPGNLVLTLVLPCKTTKEPKQNTDDRKSTNGAISMQGTSTLQVDKKNAHSIFRQILSSDDNQIKFTDGSGALRVVEGVADVTEMLRHVSDESGKVMVEGKKEPPDYHVDKISTPLLITTLDGKVQFLNKKAHSFLGYKTSNLFQGCITKILVNNKEFEKLPENLDDVFFSSGKNSLTFRDEVICHNGREKLVDITMAEKVFNKEKEYVFLFKEVDWGSTFSSLLKESTPMIVINSRGTIKAVTKRVVNAIGPNDRDILEKHIASFVATW
eukprot:CAMPEP_0168511714 /NCGR_PEP_ID=MMETSP0405-20121227/2319_1 /TAXON_ID=498012 /ORGANISM="Trichosphaerium sp, Strain Am-I-7 wt" /LENGTH=893 /DNA_ID=CAMNT_0008529983 /DNA_START=86 /DNA_END=2764 /DNA_ORIENTATION=+